MSYIQSPLTNVFGPLAVLLFVIFSISIIRETFRDVAVIRPIVVPRDLADRGYTPDVVSQRLLDQIELINSRNEIVARPFLKKPKLFHAELSEMDLQLPGLGLSFRSALSYLRSMVGNDEIEVSGEIVKEDDKGGYTLRLRVSSDKDRYSDVTVEGTPNGAGTSALSLDLLLRNGALETVRLLDPYALAIYYLDKEKSEAPAVIQYCEDSELQCRPWATLLWALMDKDDKRVGEAIDGFRRALQEFGSPTSAWPAYGMANAYLADLLISRSRQAGRQSDGSDYAEARGIYENAIWLFQHHGRTGWSSIGKTTSDPYDQFYLGHLYESGLAFGHADCTTAAVWYRLAANQGEARAQNSLGDLYSQFDVKACDGLPPRNYASALYWYQVAAQNNQVYAQRHLGEMYRDGQGISGASAIGTAIRWLQRAAKNGDLQARVDLGQIYEDGRGLQQQDLIKAHAWFDLACQAQGAGRDKACSMSDQTEKKLTREELSMSKNLAQEWNLGHDF